jgi:hypothetical protein
MDLDSTRQSQAHSPCHTRSYVYIICIGKLLHVLTLYISSMIVGIHRLSFRLFDMLNPDLDLRLGLMNAG